MLRLGCFTALFALLVSFVSVASDVEKEKRWADQIVDALIDGAAVLAAVPAREKIKADGVGGAYASKKVEGANHFFDGKEDALVDSVSDWLTATVVGG